MGAVDTEFAEAKGRSMPSKEQFVRVLLVDDDEDMYILTRQLLRQAPGTSYEIDWVPTAQEALDELGQQYDIVLLDYVLHEATGLEVLREIVRKRPHLPVIILTAHGNREIDVEALNAGAADYIAKSELNPNLLDRSIRYALERSLKLRELEQLADRLQVANARLSHKNEELEQFIYMASHDFREPLRQIMSFSEFLRRDIGHTLSGRAEQSLNFMVGAAKRMDDLVEALAKLLRASRKEITRVRVSLDQCVDRALEELTERVRTSNATIIRDPMPHARCEPTSMAHLFQNLIDNALKYCDKPHPEIHLTAEKGGQKWILGVKDNGCGIAQEHYNKIFSPFRRLHRRDQCEGTGIGLAICKKVVEAHGGEIWVESEVGKGSHFKFTLGATGFTTNTTDDLEETP